MKRVLNSLQVTPITDQSFIGERGVVVGSEGADKSGEWLADRRATGIREVANEPE